MPNATVFWLLLINRARKTPWVIHWHSDVIGDQASKLIKFFYPLYAFFETKILKRAALIISTSEPYKASSKPLMPFLDKTTVIPLGIKDVKKNKIIKTSNDFVVLSVGRLTYYKGFESLIKAFAKLKDEPLNLKIVGNGEEFDNLNRLIKKLDLQSRVKILTGVTNENLSDIYQSCDVFCLPSIERTEAFGVVLLEAMRAKKPCIVTNVRGSGMSYVVKHNETGLIVNKNDPSALAQEILNLYKNPKFAGELGDRGSERYLSQFHIRETSASIDLQYRRILSSSSKDL